MRKYACYNRQPGRETVTVQDGWTDVIDEDFQPPLRTRMPRMIEIPDPMSRDCGYTRFKQDDPACAGCFWQVNKPT